VSATCQLPVLNALCEAFNARDIERLTLLLLESVELDFPGLHTDYGVAAARGALGATMYRSDAFIAPEWRQQSSAARVASSFVSIAVSNWCWLGGSMLTVRPCAPSRA
jgi:hypothetical protein